MNQLFAFLYAFFFAPLFSLAGVSTPLNQPCFRIRFQPPILPRSGNFMVDAQDDADDEEEREEKQKYEEED